MQWPALASSRYPAPATPCTPNSPSPTTPPYASSSLPFLPTPPPFFEELGRTEGAKSSKKRGGLGRLGEEGAAIDDHDCAGHQRGGVAGEEDDDPGDVVGVGKPPQRDLLAVGLPHVVRRLTG